LTPVEKFDLENSNLMHGGIRALFAALQKDHDAIAAAGFGAEACGYNTEQGYYMFYYGLHQPASQIFNLQEGDFQVDVIDTWNMTIDTVMEHATGQTSVPLPGRKYMAIRIQKLNDNLF
jgi:hypothetical protein